jgi:hypothetical protein
VWGDPAFDVAFCLSHLALKSVLLPQHRESFRRAALEFRRGYFTSLPPDERGGVDRRVRALVAALALARVAGGSQVEYLSASDRKVVTRAAVESLLSDQPLGTLLSAIPLEGENPW